MEIEKLVPFLEEQYNMLFLVIHTDCVIFVFVELCLKFPRSVLKKITFIYSLSFIGGRGRSKSKVEAIGGRW